MEKSNRFTHIYGYIVCLVSVITFIICVTNFVNAVIDKTDPLHAGFSANNLASFETYKLDLMKSMQSKEGNLQNALPDDKSLRVIYQTAKQDKIDQVLFTSNRTIIVCSLLIIVCIILFTTHWHIARKSIKAAEA
ncbi:hypothetical protein [uncultured Acetobacteroides sp.]|uniref:hypothetical protein n=1 Tax=uncultured Acetobacteroides sp. TaxID=1760811 RepID=UPI0029F5579E|nr:hypothetical protein [uncultured Acetobacteroides sp.]